MNLPITPIFLTISLVIIVDVPLCRIYFSTSRPFVAVYRTARRSPFPFISQDSILEGKIHLCKRR